MYNEGVREEQIVAAEKVMKLLSPPLSRAISQESSCDNTPSSIAAWTLLFHPREKL